MKINGIQAQNIYEKYQNIQQGGQSKAADAQKDRGDTLELSAGAADLKEAGSLANRASAADTTDRAAKIADIKNRIDAGTYSVSSADVAKSVLRGRVFDTIA